MTERTLMIGRWEVEFYFAADGEYDTEELLDRLYDFGATASQMRGAMRLMDSSEMNTGFTFSNPNERLAIVAIGPTTSNSEFLNTLVHEVHHLAVAIAESLGVDLRDEGPAYLSGDLAYELASVICDLGCSCEK